jgi:hypothetical protein
MPDDTTILSLPLIQPAQAQKHVTHNEALVQLDLIVQLAVINRTLTTAPALPSIGDRHIVAAGATGPWVGQSGRIALYTVAGWQFTQPLPGWQAQVLSEGQVAVFDGLVWKAPSEGPLTVARLGVSATADATNRLSVSAPATLLNHAGAGHQLKLNKATTGDTASLLFQTGFSGRAEMGTAGSDDFSVKVSADGATFFTAFEADAATGEVTLPQPVHLGGQAADRGAPADGTLWLNTTTGEVKVRSGGATLPVGGGGGGGISDGDKGDITVSGAGATWTIDPGAVTLAKLADVSTDSFLGRDTAGTGTPEVLTPGQARGILNVADGATANASDASLRDRSTHTGTQAAATITGLAGVATSGSAADLTVGVLPAARFDDTGHGNRAGGTLHAAATGSVAGFMAAADKVKLDGVATGANNYSHPNHSGDVTSAGDGATTIASDAVTNAKLANMGNGTLKGRATAGTGDPEDLTGAQATALLDTFTSGAKGLAPASGGGTANFLRADGTWAAPAGGGGAGSPGGVSGEIQWNNAGAFAGAADVEIEGGQLRLPSIASPTAPAAAGIKLYSRTLAGQEIPAFKLPSAQSQTELYLQTMIGEGGAVIFLPAGGTTVTTLGAVSSGTGTATAANVTNGTRRQRMKRIEYLVTTAATTAVAGWYHNASQHTVGGANAWEGGFTFLMHGGPATGVATASHRFFMGMRDVGTPTDVEPSTFLRCIGIGYDSADANLQFIRNDATGTATKIDLGASFAIPTTDRAAIWRLRMFSPPGPTQSVSYEVTNIDTGVVASGTVTTDLPSTTSFISPRIQASAGGTSSVIGVAIGSVQVQTEV